jgi:hypothetical protein
MALANVANTDTFQTWLTRTNQLVGGYNQLSAGFGDTISSSNTITSTNTTMALNVASGYIKVKANIFDSNVVTVISNTQAISITGTGRLGDRLYVNVGTLSSITSDRSNTNIASANAVNTINEYARYLANSINLYAAATYSTSGVSSLAPANAWANLVGASANSFQANYIVGSTAAANISAARSANAWANLVGAAANSRIISSSGLANAEVTVAGSFTSTSDIIAKNTFITSKHVISNGSVLSAQTGMKNRLINGDFRIWQRNITFTPVTYSVSTGYTADRWYINRLGGLSSTVVAGISAISLNNADRNSIRVRRVAGDAYTGSGYRIELAQQIETMNFADLGGKGVVLSFWARKGTNFSGTFQVGITTGTGTNEPSYVGFTGEASPLLETVTLSTSYTKFTLLANIPNNHTEARVFFLHNPSGTAGSNDWFEVTDVQLEQGYHTSSEFERRDYATEFAMCRRYYENGLGWNGAIDGIDPSGSVYAQYTRATISGYYHILTVPYRVTKRTAGTVGIIPFISGTPSPVVPGNVRNLTLNKNVPATIDNISNNFFNVNIGTTPQTGNPGPVVDDVYDSNGFAFNWTVNAEL